jgi:hypothetical protein
VAVLGVAGQPVLIVVSGDDRVGPPRTRLDGQRLLTVIEPIPARLPLGCIVHRAVQRFGPRRPGEVRAPQPAQMLGNQVEHMLVVGRGLQPGSDRQPARPGHRLHLTPLPQLLRRHAPSSNQRLWH